MNNQPEKQWIVKSDSSSVALDACELIKNAAEKAIKQHGVFKLVLAGGTTPERIYTMLAKQSLDWANWEIFLGDERCLPESSDDRNSKMAQRTLLDHVEIPSQNIFFIPSELGSDIAAKQYAETIQSKLPFDLVLLGMGEDGHTASLFPGHVHDTNELVHAVQDAPKPPADRVSISASSLSNSQQVLIIVTGAGKKDRVEDWLDKKDLPVAGITALETLTIILDKDASPS